MDIKVWQLNKFSEVVGGTHYTTLNDWFNMLESKRLHWVNRVADNKRVYDELDLKVALYIKERRSQGWGLSAICDVIKDDIPDLRPIPEEVQQKNESSLELQNKDLLEKMFEAKFVELYERLKNDKDDFVKLIADNQKQESTEKEILKGEITRSRLKIEALQKWEAKPINERYIKKGFFRSEEDINKRDIFIENYIIEHFEKRLKQKEN